MLVHHRWFAPNRNRHWLTADGQTTYSPFE
jgi:hypothetical protein